MKTNACDRHAVVPIKPQEWDRTKDQTIHTLNSHVTDKSKKYILLQYKKYKKVPVEQLAAEAVMQQAEMTRLEPKTGNKLIDMLHENGIPIGNSLKGLEQAIKTQREIENTDPAQQVFVPHLFFAKFQSMSCLTWTLKFPFNLHFKKVGFRRPEKFLLEKTGNNW